MNGRVLTRGSPRHTEEVGVWGSNHETPLIPTPVVIRRISMNPGGNFTYIPDVGSMHAH